MSLSRDITGECVAAFQSPFARDRFDRPIAETYEYNAFRVGDTTASITLRTGSVNMRTNVYLGTPRSGYAELFFDDAFAARFDFASLRVLLDTISALFNQQGARRGAAPAQHAPAPWHAQNRPC